MSAVADVLKFEARIVELEGSKQFLEETVRYLKEESLGLKAEVDALRLQKEGLENADTMGSVVDCDICQISEGDCGGTINLCADHIKAVNSGYFAARDAS